jgi:hypothetical protein
MNCVRGRKILTMYSILLYSLWPMGKTITIRWPATTCLIIYYYAAVFIHNSDFTMLDLKGLAREIETGRE